MKVGNFEFEVGPTAWCEHCGELAKGQCAHGHPAIGVSAEDSDGIRWCPDCLASNGDLTEKQRKQAWALL